MNRSVKEIFWKFAKRQPVEKALRKLITLAPDRCWRTLRKVVPQPSTYTSNDKRTVERYGLDWELTLNRYFDWHHYYSFPDPVIRCIRQIVSPSDTCIDVGANIGFYTLIMAQMAEPGGTVLFAEPLPNLYKSIKVHYQKNKSKVSNVKGKQVAVGEASGKVELAVPVSEDYGKTSALSGGREYTIDSYTCITIPDLLGHFDEDGVDVVKLDVEGYEMKVIGGGVSVIESYKPHLILEFNPNKYQKKESYKVIKKLIDTGYEFYEIDIDSKYYSEIDLLCENNWRDGQKDILAYT